MADVRWPLIVALAVTACAPAELPAGSASPVANPSPSPTALPRASPSASATSPSTAIGGIEVFATGPLHGTYVWVVSTQPAPQDRVTEALFAVPLDGSAPRLAFRRLRDRDAVLRTPLLPFRQLSTDGTQLALEQSPLGPAAHDGFIVIDLVAGTLREIARGDQVSDAMPAWSPDGQRIAFARSTGTPGSPDGGLWVINADGTGVRRILPGACCAQRTIVFGWTADGSGIAFAVAFEGADYSVANATTGTVTGPHGEGFGSGAPADWRVKAPQFAAAFSAGNKGGDQRIDIADGIGTPQRTVWREPMLDPGRGEPILRDARWSPVGEEVLFIRSIHGASKLVRLPVPGGIAMDVATDAEPLRAEWLPDGAIAYTTAAGVSVARAGRAASIWLAAGGAPLDLAVRTYP